MQNLIDEVVRNGNYMQSSHFSCKPTAPGQQTRTQSICLSTVDVNWEWKVAKGIATRSIMDVDNSQPWTLQSTCCNTGIETQQHAIQVRYSGCGGHVKLSIMQSKHQPGNHRWFYLLWNFIQRICLDPPTSIEWTSAVSFLCLSRRSLRPSLTPHGQLIINYFQSEYPRLTGRKELYCFSGRMKDETDWAWHWI